MHRRNFLIGTASLFIAGRSAVAGPCNPTLDGATNNPTCPGPQSSGTLTEVANQISFGDWVDYPDGIQSAFSKASMEWQTDFYHDSARDIVHLMGKPANANSSWQHQYFDISNSTWRQVTGGISNWSYFGHIYGNNTIDESTGDLYQTVGMVSDVDSRKAWRYRASSGIWDRRAPESGVYTDTALNSTCNGAAWHPNLFGPGDGGLVIDQQITTLYWQKSTDQMSEASHPSNEFGRKEGIGIYWPARDVALVGGSTGNSLAMVAPGGSGIPVRTKLPAPPITTSGQSRLSSSSFGSLHVHPSDPNKIILVETTGPRTWISSDASSWQQMEDHPFNREPRVVCSLRSGLGCLWAVGNDDSSFSRLWKPRI